MAAADRRGAAGRRGVGEMTKKPILSDNDHARVSEAVRRVEQRTSGEVFTAIARRSDDYFFVSGFIAGVWALGFGMVFGLSANYWSPDIPIWTIPLTQVLVFVSLLVVLRLSPSLTMAMVPRKIAYRRASANAVRQFFAHNLHTTSQRSGILLFVSLDEHYAEVVADAGIDARVDQESWDKLVEILVQHAKDGQLADGFVKAVEEAGGLLAVHFPPGVEDQNELDDRLVEL